MKNYYSNKIGYDSENRLSVQGFNSPYIDFSTGMSYLQNQIQHKKLVQDCENRFSVQGPNSP